MRSRIYEGRVGHARRAPTPHVFRHRACMYLIDLDEAPRLDRGLRLFGLDRPAPVQLRTADHVGHRGASLRANIEAELARRGVDPPGGPIRLLTNLRVLGYVFNPISVWWCHRPDGALAVVVAEVSNTFGERHLYVLPADDAERQGTRWVWTTDKRMHVSPFFPTGGTYRFDMTEPGERIRIAISYVPPDGPPFHAAFAGRAAPLTDRSLALTQVRHPLMPHRVTALIHGEALRLWRTGAPFHRIPRFRVGEGSEPAEPAPAAPAEPRRGLLPPPPARRTPAAAAVRALMPWALSRPPAGALTITMPDGRSRTSDSGRPGPHAHITVHSRDLFHRVARRGMTGVGEAYVAGNWDADDLPAAIEGLLRISESRRTMPTGRVSTALRDARPRLPQRVSLALAGRHIRYHYDLGNDLYELFLDESLTYSCALFTDPDATLEQAQLAKHRAICDKLGLRAGDHVLEIGCGWGAFAAVAAGEYGASVTGLTLSAQQHAEATARMRRRGLDDRVRILLQDYREHRGTYTHIASTEMIEAIGHRQLPVFFRACDRLLAPNGRVAIQVITMPDQRYDRYLRSRDWISEYIFPGAACPSLSAMVDAMRRSSDLLVHDLEDIGIHYAETLRRWRLRFDEGHAAVRALGFDESFVRGWRFYLASCEAAFRARSITDLQMVLTRPFNDCLPGIAQASTVTPFQKATRPRISPAAGFGSA